MIEILKDSVDKVLVGGAMAFTFFKVKGLDVGNSLLDTEMLEVAEHIRKSARDKGIKFYLPVDFVVAENMNSGAQAIIVTSQEIPTGWTGLDIGTATVRLYTEAIQDAKTIMWNRPLGLFEKDAYSRGTFAIAHAVAGAYATTIAGGGASLELLEGKELPGLAALPDAGN